MCVCVCVNTHIFTRSQLLIDIDILNILATMGPDGLRDTLFYYACLILHHKRCTRTTPSVGCRSTPASRRMLLRVSARARTHISATVSPSPCTRLFSDRRYGRRTRRQQKIMIISHLLIGFFHLLVYSRFFFFSFSVSVWSVADDAVGSACSARPIHSATIDSTTALYIRPKRPCQSWFLLLFCARTTMSQVEFSLLLLLVLLSNR